MDSDIVIRSKGNLLNQSSFISSIAYYERLVMVKVE